MVLCSIIREQIAKRVATLVLPDVHAIGGQARDFYAVDPDGGFDIKPDGLTYPHLAEVVADDCVNCGSATDYSYAGCIDVEASDLVATCDGVLDYMVSFLADHFNVALNYYNALYGYSSDDIDEPVVKSRAMAELYLYTRMAYAGIQHEIKTEQLMRALESSFEYVNEPSTMADICATQMGFDVDELKLIAELYRDCGGREAKLADIHAALLDCVD